MSRPDGICGCDSFVWPENNAVGHIGRSLRPRGARISLLEISNLDLGRLWYEFEARRRKIVIRL